MGGHLFHEVIQYRYSNLWSDAQCKLNVSRMAKQIIVSGYISQLSSSNGTNFPNLFYLFIGFELYNSVRSRLLDFSDLSSTYSMKEACTHMDRAVRKSFKKNKEYE